MAAASIPRFQTQLPRFFTYAPTLTRNAQGQVTRKDFTVRMAKFNDQQLPSGFPSTPLFGYGGDVFVRYDANGQPVPALEQTGPVQFMRTSPGPKFEQTRNVPDVTHYRNELAGDHLGPSIRRSTGRTPTTSPSRRRRSRRSRPGTRRRSRRSRTRRTRTASRC